MTLVVPYSANFPYLRIKNVVMTEDILHFVWIHNFNRVNGLFIDGSGEVEVISPGDHNFDSGPDFFNAKIKVGDTIWAGNVEIHINASDWNKHGHNHNPQYDSVILHVVVKNDTQVFSSKGEVVPTVEIPYPDELEWKLHQLIANETWIPCANHIKNYGDLNLSMWLSALAVERLEQKTEQVFKLVSEFKGGWEEAFYVSISRSFGLKINAVPFEMLARATPLKYLARAKDSILTLEAVLLGQAGMLDFKTDDADEYMLSLSKEYDYQQMKFGLSPIPGHLWKFLRLRPSSFPTLRIAQLAQLIHHSSGLFSKCMYSTSFDKLQDLLRSGCSHYWMTHYTFGKISPAKLKVLGDDTIRTITLNTIIPFMFAYGSSRANQGLKDRAVTFLESLKPEKNSIIDGFAKLGISAESAFSSQALLQLKGQYCDKRKCLYCKVGASVLLKKVD